MYFLNINKPKGMTSFDVIRKLRKILNTKQIGHSGTLDPLASGVLQVAVGKATKLLDFLPSDKEYIADIKFGYVSTTYDSEGELSFVSEPNFSKEDLLKISNSFIGKTSQYPPKYSAVKVNGLKMCDLVRFKPEVEFEIKPRDIEIYSIELLEFNVDTAKIKVKSKKGVYIRSLVSDIGKKIGCGAYITDLIRTKAGLFNIENSNNLDDTFLKINPIDALELYKYELNQEEYNLISHGLFLNTDLNIENQIILLTKNNKLVSLANLSDNQIRPKRFFGEG